MINVGILVAVFFAGLILGGFFYGGLLWTIQRGLLSKHPGAWFLVSLIVRISVVVSAFYLLFNGQWERLMLCVAGFFIARMLLTRYIITAKISCNCAKEADDAS